MATPDFLAALHRESSRFVDVLQAVDPSRQVPSCPDWTANDLLWHLCEVQWFWATIVQDRLLEPDEAEQAKPPRPDDHAELVDLFAQGTRRLLAALMNADPSVPVWTWANDQTVGFVRRRQAHEALIHRLDAELTAGTPTPFDPELAADGVDELLRVYHEAWPDWISFTSDGTRVWIEATDTGTAWRVETGQYRGTSPTSGTRYDEPGLVVADTSPADATVRGEASALDAWLWGRTSRSHLDADGDHQALSRLDAVVAAGIQ